MIACAKPTRCRYPLERLRISLSLTSFVCVSSIISSVCVFLTFLSRPFSSATKSRYSRTVDVYKRQKLYSLTDTTKDYVKNLSQDVTIYVLSSEKSADSTLAETLQRYEDLSKHLNVVYKDPAKSPNFYQQYTDSAPSQNSMIVVSDARSRVVDYSDIYEYSYDYSTYSSSVDGYDCLLYTSWMLLSDRPAAWMQPGIRKMRTSGKKVYHIRRKNIWLQQ